MKRYGGGGLVVNVVTSGRNDEDEQPTEASTRGLVPVQ